MSKDERGAEVRILFPTPVIIDQLEDAAELNNALEQGILANRDTNDGLKLSNRRGWQSAHDLLRWSGEAGQRVVNHAGDLANRHVIRAAWAQQSWTIEAWANVSGSGGFNMPHVHGGTFWAAVYYVRIGAGEGGQLVLHDPRMPALRMHAPGLGFRNMGPDVKAEIQPKEGMMVLFPAWLSHSVEPWEGAGERISVAMNIRATR